MSKSKPSNKPSKKPIGLLTIVAIAAIAAAVYVLTGHSLTANTMRLLRREGIVRLFDSESKERTITDNLRLAAGNVLNTDNKSLAGIALDDTKIVTVDEKSRVQFDKKGKKLDVNLTEGSLFFEVTKKLDDDESFDIRTSTMVVGIRGTSGYVSVDDFGHEAVYITDGVVEVTGTNPVTGETKTVTVKAGQRAIVYLYNDRTVNSIMFQVEDIKEDDLNSFVVARLQENFRLIEDVCSETGWSRDKIMGFDVDVMLAEEDEAVETVRDQADITIAGIADPTVKSRFKASDHVVSTSAAGVMTLTDGREFDPVYYAETNPDVVAEIGTDPEKLLEHYLSFGMLENRYGTAKAREQAEAEGAQAYQEFQNAINRANAEAAAKAAQEAQVTQSANSGGDSGGNSQAIVTGERGEGGRVASWGTEGAPTTNTDP